MRASFSPGSDEPLEPEGWAEVDGGWRCLACRRAEVLEAVVDAPGASTAMRGALAEFELRRDPSASDRAIARRIKCSTSSVTSIRAKLQSAGPPSPEQ